MWDLRKANCLTAEEMQLRKLNKNASVSIEEQFRVWALRSDPLGQKPLLLYFLGQVTLLSSSSVKVNQNLFEVMYRK